MSISNQAFGKAKVSKFDEAVQVVSSGLQTVTRSEIYQLQYEVLKVGHHLKIAFIINSLDPSLLMSAIAFIAKEGKGAGTKKLTELGYQVSDFRIMSWLNRPTLTMTLKPIQPSGSKLLPKRTN